MRIHSLFFNISNHYIVKTLYSQIKIRKSRTYRDSNYVPVARPLVRTALPTGCWLLLRATAPLLATRRTFCSHTTAPSHPLLPLVPALENSEGALMVGEERYSSVVDMC